MKYAKAYVWKKYQIKLQISNLTFRRRSSSDSGPWIWTNKQRQVRDKFKQIKIKLKKGSCWQNGNGLADFGYLREYSMRKSGSSLFGANIKLAISAETIRVYV